MSHQIHISVASITRFHPSKGTYGAAAAFFHGSRTGFTTPLSPNPAAPLTTESAALMAVILALKEALEKHRLPNPQATLDVTIYTCSQYIHGVMAFYIDHWNRHGWVDDYGASIANEALIKHAEALMFQLKYPGDVRFLMLLKVHSRDAQQLADEEMTRVERILLGYL